MTSMAYALHNELPEEKGFSERNIKRMLAFYREYPLLNFVPQAVAQIGAAPEAPQAQALFQAQLLQAIPWGHHAELMAKVKDLPTRRWYMQTTLQHGWSRNILVMQIESAAHRRQGRTISNFANSLPEPDSDLVQHTLKDPYLFDFLTPALNRLNGNCRGVMNEQCEFFGEIAGWGVGIQRAERQRRIGPIANGV